MGLYLLNRGSRYLKFAVEIILKAQNIFPPDAFTCTAVHIFYTRSFLTQYVQNFSFDFCNRNLILLGETFLTAAATSPIYPQMHIDSCAAASANPFNDDN